MNKILMEKLVDRMQNLPYHRFIGINIVSWGEGVSQISFSASNNNLNPYGAMHGGIYYTVCDVAAYLAATSLVPDDKVAVTTDINVSVLSSVSQGNLTVKGSVIKMGKRICFIDSRVFDQNDNLIAIARVTKSIIPFAMAELLTGNEA
jgi:uncharacterized protein (TIGR00369 family)